ncbi:MAG: helix-turn-helix domain-containing protein, partial [Woeseiaceae bacterium]
DNPLPEILQNNLSATVNETLTLLNDGLEIDAIASQRDIKISTAYTHIADAIEAGLIEAKEALQLSDDEYNEIIAALELNIDNDGRLKPIYEALDEHYNYGIIKCVQASFI